MPGAGMRLGLFLCLLLAFSAVMGCLWLMARYDLFYDLWPQR
jgi:hypothetical protein